MQRVMMHFDARRVLVAVVVASPESPKERDRPSRGDGYPDRRQDAVRSGPAKTAMNGPSTVD